MFPATSRTRSGANRTLPGSRLVLLAIDTANCSDKGMIAYTRPYYDETTHDRSLLDADRYRVHGTGHDRRPGATARGPGLPSLRRREERVRPAGSRGHLVERQHHALAAARRVGRQDVPHRRRGRAAQA